MGSRTEYWDDPQAPVPNSLVPACGVLALDEEGRLLLQRRAPRASDEASEVRWVTAAELSELDIHPTQWRQLRHYLQHAYPHFD
jgi:isopentenyldiphosphate isomerase